MLDIHAIPLLPKIAAGESTILVTGPTGAGKSVLAERIHRLSARRERRFVSVNLATLNENLIESELFGHERGAFSGANLKRIGKLESANGGTVFLDEIGELSPSMQTRLLEVLNSKIISPVGSNRDIRLDVRVIAATNRSLADMVAAGTFRADLYFRINTFAIDLPALAKNPEAIPARARDFLRLAAGDRPAPAFSDCFLAAIRAYAWPGNLRELKNAVEYALTVAEPGRELLAADLPQYIQRSPCGSASATTYGNFPVNFHEAKDRFERDYIHAMLTRFGGRINLTSRETQLSKVTLIDKIRKFQIDVNALRIAAYGRTKQSDLVRYL